VAPAAGPLAGLNAIYAGMSGADRERVLMPILGSDGDRQCGVAGRQAVHRNVKVRRPVAADG
jgi:hypothetical protein